MTAFRSVAFRMGLLAALAAGAFALSGCSSHSTATPPTTTHERTELIIRVALNDRDKVWPGWVATQEVGSQACTDGSTLSWTQDGYWYSTDDVFHARPGTSTLEGPYALVHKCAPVR